MSAVTSEELQQAWQKVKHAKTLPDPPTIKLPLFSIKTPIKTRLIGIQHVINTLEYNYTGTQYFDVNKNRSFKSIVSTAKDIVNETLPIQCLEAVFLASYLTANASDLERFPISFKSIAGTNVHRHIILAVRYQHNKWGALGLSRSDKLMYKELKYASLSELIQDFCHEFELLYHRVLKVYVGFPFSHDIHSSEKVEWRVMNISLEFNEWTDAAQHFDSFAKDAVDILAYKKSKGVLPESFAAKFLLHTPESESGASKNAIKSPDKRRLTFSPSTFEFPPAGYEEDDAAADSLKAGEASPEKDLPKPILVAPDRLEFKPTLANAAQVLPTNIFLQNTTCFPYLVKIDEASRQLEIVTRGAVEDRNNNNRNNSSGETQCPPAAAFRVSAKGMIVVAIKCNVPSSTPSLEANALAASDGAQKTSHEIVISTSRNIRSSGSSVVSRKHAKHDAGKQTGNSKSAPSLRPVVTFTCSRLVRRDGDQAASEVEDDETFVYELPFTTPPATQ